MTFTPLSRAAQIGHVQEVLTLIEAGADIKIDCETLTKPCCSKGIPSHYTYSSCYYRVGVGKRKDFTHTDECEPNTWGPSTYQGMCTYDEMINM